MSGTIYLATTSFHLFCTYGFVPYGQCWSINASSRDYVLYLPSRITRKTHLHRTMSLPDDSWIIRAHRVYWQYVCIWGDLNPSLCTHHFGGQFRCFSSILKKKKVFFRARYFSPNNANRINKLLRPSAQKIHNRDEIFPPCASFPWFSIYTRSLWKCVYIFQLFCGWRGGRGLNTLNLRAISC